MHLKTKLNDRGVLLSHDGKEGSKTWTDRKPAKGKAKAKSKGKSK